MSVFKNFLSPKNYDSRSYASQLSAVVSTTFPLMTLGYVSAGKLYVWAIVAFIITGVINLIALFAKNKVCPQWLRNTISDGLSSYNLFCLPAIILYVSDGYDEQDILFFSNRLYVLIFGIAWWIFAVVSDINFNRKAEKKRMENERR